MEGKSVYSGFLNLTIISKEGNRTGTKTYNQAANRRFVKFDEILRRDFGIISQKGLWICIARFAKKTRRRFI